MPIYVFIHYPCDKEDICKAHVIDQVAAMECGREWEKWKLLKQIIDDTVNNDKRNNIACLEAI